MPNKATSSSISLPQSLWDLIDSIAPNRSRFFKDLACRELEQQGIYGESWKARLVAAIQGIEGDITEGKLEELLGVLTSDEREQARRKAGAV